jgi:predicted transcriptional regulator
LEIDLSIAASFGHTDGNALTDCRAPWTIGGEVCRAYTNGSIEKNSHSESALREREIYTMPESSERLRELVAEVAAAYFSNSPVAASEIANVISQVAIALAGVGGSVEAKSSDETSSPAPVVAGDAATATKLSTAQVRRSITPEALISFEDGKPYKTLKRHLSSRGLTVEEYKSKWGLPADYPMVSPSYSASRSAMAISLGLGQKGGRRQRAKA